jgi:tetratricopeptide (TPR) repeat protein
MKRGNNSDPNCKKRPKPLRLLVLSCLLVGCLPAPAEAEGPSVDFEKRVETLQREAYYHFFLGDYLTAATRLKLAEEIPGTSEKVLNDTRLLLGGLYISWGMYRPATVLFDHWVTRFPPGGKRNELLLLIERLQYRRALYRDAIETYAMLIPDESFPSMDHARYLAGMSRYMLGWFEEAIRLMESIPEDSVYFPFARLAMAQSYVQLNDDQKALSILKELDRMNPRGDPVVRALTEKSRLNTGLLMIEQGQYQEARPVLSSISATSPFFPDALFGEGWADFNARRYSQALPYFQELYQDFPDHPYALEGLISIGGIYQRIGAAAKSLQSYGEALQIYDRRAANIRKLQARVRDRSQLAGWLDGSGAVQDDPLDELLDDDRIRYQISQYREIASLSSYLDRKLTEMGVFKIMLDHRQEVFRGHLPTLRGFLAENPVSRLQQRERRLHSRIEDAIRNEEVTALATPREGEALNQLAVAEDKGKSLEKKFGRSEFQSPERAELKKELQTANRKLALLHGEILWNIITEAPGRIDDFRREANGLEAGLAALDVRETRLTDSIPSLENRLDRLRKRIDGAQRSLLQKRELTGELRMKMIPSLQASLLNALDKKQDRMERFAAAARLSQIQILDSNSRP